jgi:hypothetical protein
MFSPLSKGVSNAPEDKLLSFYIKCYNSNKPADWEEWTLEQ